MSLDNFKGKGKKGKKDELMNFGIVVEDEEELFDLSEYTKYNINIIEDKTELSGRPFLQYFSNEEQGKNYDSVRLQIINDEDKEVVNAYCNIPLGYPTVKDIRRNSNFYKSTYNLILGVFNADEKLDDTIFYTSDGKPMNKISEINIEAIINYVNTKKEIKVRVVENNDGYNTFVVLGLK